MHLPRVRLVTYAALASTACGLGVEGALAVGSGDGGAPPPPTASLPPTGSSSTSQPPEADASADADASTTEGGPDAGAITFLQAVHSDYVTAKTNSATLSVGAGSALVVATYENGTQAMSVSDTLGNTWVAATMTAGTSCSTSVGKLWYALNAKGGPDTVTVTVASTTDIGITVAEYAGVALASALDAQSAAIAPSSSNAMAAPSLTTTAARSVIVALFHDTYGGGTMTPGAGFVARARDTGFYTLLQDDAPGVGPGVHPVTAALPVGTSDACWGGMAVALKAP